jgi:hypothetical protein
MIHVNLDEMSFVALKSEGKEIILNTDRIITVSLNNENKVLITCTDQIKIVADDPEEEVRKKLGVRKDERKVGFGSVSV